MSVRMAEREKRKRTPWGVMNVAAVELVRLRLREVRAAKKMSYTQLAVASGLNTNYPKQRMRELLTGSNSPGLRLGSIYALCCGLDVDICAVLPTFDEVMEEAVRLSDAEHAFPESGHLARCNDERLINFNGPVDELAILCLGTSMPATEYNKKMQSKRRAQKVEDDPCLRERRDVRMSKKMLVALKKNAGNPEALRSLQAELTPEASSQRSCPP